MKLLIGIIFVLSTAFRCYAQENPDTLQYLHAMEKYRKKRNAGIILTSIAPVLLYGGAFLALDNPDSAGEVIGTTAVLLAPVSFATGLTLWISNSGKKKLNRKYERKLEKVSVRVKAGPQFTALSLTYRL